MPDRYTVKEFAAKIRERRPDLGDIPDMTLVGKTLGAAPELRQYIIMPNEEPAYQSPVYGPTGATGKQVMQDQAAEVLKGVPQAVTGIPGMLKGLGGIAYDAATGNAQGAVGGAGEMAKGALAPVATIGQGLGALAAPNSVNPPSDEKWQQAAQAGGAVLGTAGLDMLAATLADAMPSKARAGAKLDKLAEALKDAKPDLAAANEAIKAARYEKATGAKGPIDPAMRMLEARQQPITGDFAGTQVQMQPNPINYPESFKFASNAGEQTAFSSSRTARSLLAKQAQFTEALKTANRAEAVKAGLGDMYDSAMLEYRMAKTLEGAQRVIGKYTSRLALGASLGAGGKAGYDIYTGLTGH